MLEKSTLYQKQPSHLQETSWAWILREQSPSEPEDPSPGYKIRLETVPNQDITLSYSEDTAQHTYISIISQ